MSDFEEWVKTIFDRPLPESYMNEWYWTEDDDLYPTLSPAQIVDYLTRLFEQSAELLADYSDGQINQGLMYLMNNACSSYAFALLDESVPWENRRQCFNAMPILFEGVFAVRCTPYLSHLDELDVTSLNSICYMWWDVIPFLGQPDKPAYKALDQACLDVMEKTLKLKSDACRENALHGLGHWHFVYPERVEKIIDAFLKANPNIRKELKQYALSARAGCVL
jgi:hypothetical protein